MEKEVLIANNPLRAIGLETRAEEDNKLGLVMARAGLGKTAILVQLALDYMMRDIQVLHVSIGESVDKTRSWYDDIVERITGGERLEDLEAILQNRMIMTFKENSFDQAKFQERLDDLVQQDVYAPECLILDGFDFDANDRGVIENIKEVLVKSGIKMVWFSAVSHRGDDRVSAAGVPAPCHEIDDMFDTVLFINPGEESIKLDIVKCESCSIDAGTTLHLDPSTMMIKKG